MDGILAGGAGFPGITALLAAPPTIFRLGLIGILRDHQPRWHLREADRLQAALSLPAQQTPDVLLLDEHLPDLNGIEGLQQARAVMPHVKTIVLAATEDRDAILDFIDAGAHGCLTTSANAAQVLAAFNTVLCGGVFIPASVREAMLPTSRPQAGAVQSNVSLTERQRDVFDLMARGYSTKLIARELGLAVGTVKVHLAAIYRLLGAHNRAEAVARLARSASNTEHGNLPVVLGELGWLT